MKSLHSIRIRGIGTAGILILLCIAGFLSGVSGEGIEIRSIGKQEPLSKTYIDTMVARGVYILGEAAATGDVGLARRQAVAEAKGIADKLRIQAENDPNKAYISWKVNELEWQITLEEKDIVLQKVRLDGQASVKQVSSEYNRELAKERPDFKSLVRMQARMKEFDQQRAEKMGQSIVNRSITISRLAMVSLEEALMYGNVAQANEEYRYCLYNKAYLAIPPAKFDQLETRLSQCAQVNDGLVYIDAQADSAETLLVKREPGAARSRLSAAGYRLGEIRGVITSDVAVAFSARLNSLDRRLNRCEDSLVEVNLDILSRKGPDEAGNYLEIVVHRLGVRPEKAARVDQAILAAPDARKAGGARNEVTEVAAAAEADGSHDVFEEMRLKAIKKVQARQDSIKAIDSARSRAESARFDSLEAVAKRNTERELQENRNHAMQLASEIYGMIKNDKARVAYDLFDNKKAMLRQYLPAEAFGMLESTVIQIIDPKWGVESGSIMMLAAHAAPPAGTTPAKDTAQSGPIAEKRKKAQGAIEEIYQLLEKNKKRAAVEKFESEREFLKASLGKEEYEVLVMSLAMARGKM